MREVKVLAWSAISTRTAQQSDCSFTNCTRSTESLIVHLIASLLQSISQPIVALLAAVGRNNVGRGQFETHHKGSIMRLSAKNEDRERPPVGSKWSGARVMDQ